VSIVNFKVAINEWFPLDQVIGVIWSSNRLRAQ